MKVRHIISAIALACTAFACTTAAPHAPSLYDSAGYTMPETIKGSMSGRVPVWIDKGFGIDHRMDIHVAIDTWNHSLNGYEKFDVTSDTFDMEPSVLAIINTTHQGLLILKRMHDDPVMTMLPDGVLAWVEREPGEEGHVLNVVDDVIGTRDLRAITMHEIGHALGLPHSVIKGTLLFPSYTYTADCIDRVTVQALASVRGWQWKQMSYCERPL